MEELFAGFVTGYAMSLAVAPLGAILLMRANREPGFAQRLAPPGTNIVALAVVIHLSAVLFLTMLGLVFGMALGGIEDRRPDGGLGSPNLVYTLLVVSVTAVLVIPTLALPAVRRWSGGVAVVFAALFGWAVPWLATLR